jgi:hypothetical protein
MLCFCFLCIVILIYPIATSFVDRDMLMRYHWGLGVGHTYSHSDAPTPLVAARLSSFPSAQATLPSEIEASVHSDKQPAPSTNGVDETDQSDGETESDNSELHLSDQEDTPLDAESDLESESEGHVPNITRSAPATRSDSPAVESTNTDVQDQPKLTRLEVQVQELDSQSEAAQENIDLEPVVVVNVRRSSRVRVPRRIWQPE